MGNFDLEEELGNFSGIVKQIVNDKDLRIAWLEAELAKYIECDFDNCPNCNSTPMRAGEALVVYHKNEKENK